MFRKTLATTLTVALIAGSTITAPTTASARDGRGIVAAAVGLVAGAVVATAVANARHNDGYGYRPGGDRDCFEKQFTKWNSYGEPVTVYKTICR